MTADGKLRRKRWEWVRGLSWVVLGVTSAASKSVLETAGHVGLAQEGRVGTKMKRREPLKP
jgi:hypothetical protein